jgi:hypothetical protein
MRVVGATDPSPQDAAALRYSFDFDNDGTWEVVDSASAEAIIPDALLTDGRVDRQARVRTADDDGGFVDTTLTWIVHDVAPTITLTAPRTVKVGEAFTVEVAVADVGRDTVSSIVIDWQDGTTTTLPLGDLSATHVYTGSQTTRSVAARVTNEDGTFVKTTPITIDAPPTVQRATFRVDGQYYGSMATSDTRGPAIQFLLSEAAAAGSLTADDLVLTNLTTGETVPMTAGTPGGLVFSSTQNSSNQWRWPRGLPDGNYRATLPAGSFTDIGGTPSVVDGVIDFYILAGDANRDRTVNFDDLLILARNYNQTLRNFTQGNFDYSFDGMVNFDDLLILARRYGTTLAAPATATSPMLATEASRRSRAAIDSVLD